MRRWWVLVAAGLAASLLLAGTSTPDPAPPRAAEEQTAADGSTDRPSAGPGAQAAAAAPARPAAPLPVAATPSASSSAGGSAPAALVDGDVAALALGEQWSAAPGDRAPWVQLDVAPTRRLASVQVFGPTASASGRRASSSAAADAGALHGVLRFSDGSSLVVSGIAAGAGMPTTVAFTPRAVSWVRLELDRQVPRAQVGLRELRAFAEGTTPPRWSPPSSSPTYSATPPAASCPDAPAGSSAPPAAREGRIDLVCPSPGSAVEDTATAELLAPAGSAVQVWVPWAGDAAGPVRMAQVATTTADAGGRAVVQVDLGDLPQGPFALKVTGTDAVGRPLVPVYVQLFRTRGAVAPPGQGASAPPEMTLQYVDDFSEPLSVSATGAQAQYAAGKPEPWGGSQFGEALFADPAWGAGTLATLPGGYLRIRAQDVGELASRKTWGQRHAAGILSSQRYGGSGFSAQHGYFEARIMGAPGPGAWPAFWMLDSESATPRGDGTQGEVDAVELYGHDTATTCHTTHTFTADAPGTGQGTCLPRALDWAAEWHTYAVHVTDGGADYFIDGRPVASLEQLSQTDQPFFFMVNLATGGGWPVDLSATGQVSDMYVDWVRVST